MSQTKEFAVIEESQPQHPDAQMQFFGWSLHQRSDGLIVVGGGEGRDRVTTLTAEQELRRATRTNKEQPLGIDIRDVCNLIEPKDVGLLFLQGGALSNSDVPLFCQEVRAPISIIVGPDDDEVVWDMAESIGRELTQRQNPHVALDLEDLFYNPPGKDWSRRLYLPRD